MNLKPPSTKSDSKVPTWKEIQELVKSARSGFAPGLSSALPSIKKMSKSP